MKKQKKLTVFENLIWNTVGSFTYLICQWLLTLIVVRGTNDMVNAGNLALAISITNIFFNLACFNVRPYLVSDLSNRYTSQEYSAFRVLTCVVAIFSCGGYLNFFSYTTEQITCIMLYMAFKIGEAWVDLLHGYEQRKSRMDIGGISLFIRGILSVGTFAITLFYTNSINWSIAVMAICTIAFVVLFDCPIASLYERYVPKFEFKRMVQMFLEFLPMMIGSFMSTIGANLPRQILETQKGSESLGIYSTVATPAVIVQVAASYVFNPVLTQFAQLYNEDNKSGFVKLILKISGVLLAISLACICGAWLLGEWGLGFLYGDNIKRHAYLFMPVIYYTCLNAFVWFLWHLLVVMRKLKSLLVVNAIGLVVCIGMMSKIISLHEMNGVSYTLIMYSIVLIILMTIVVVQDLLSKHKVQTGNMTKGEIL